ncbi:starch-binding domain-containing protein 1 isoform X2 [Pseudophryne corroboree]|uniref:starch-binding domain-containing protein 1 isoform X2 n=1 Tax=Pseudophryne corroboree TaxID=495146 RepID=UPI003081E9B7
MVLVAGAHQLRSNTVAVQAGKQGSQRADYAGGSMWSVLVFGILTAIFTWVWFGGRGKRREPDAGEQQPQEGRAEEPLAAGNAPDTAPCATSEESGADTGASRDAGHITTSGQGRITEPAPADRVRKESPQYVQPMSEDEVLRAGDCVQTHGTLGSPPHEDVALQPKGELYRDTVSEQAALPSAEEGYPAGVPDRDGAQTNVGDLQSPDNYGVQSNEEAIQAPDVPDKEEVKSNVEDMHSSGVSGRDGVQTNLDDLPTDVSAELQCNVEATYPPDVASSAGLQITEDLSGCPAGILTEANVQSSDILAHLVGLHEEDGTQPEGEAYPENAQQKERAEDSPTDVSQREWLQSNGEEPCSATGSVQEKVHPIRAQKVLHINGEEAIQENANATDHRNSVNILEATEDSKLKDYDLFAHHDASHKDMVSHDHSKHSSGQMDFVKHESSEQLRADMALDEHSLTNHCDAVEPIVGLQDNADVASNCIPNENTSTGLTGTHVSEELTLQDAQSSTVLDKSTNMLSLSHQDEEESPGLRESTVSEKACSSYLLDTKFHEGDYPKAKQVAAIQPMPQNVNLSFKVHYVTHSDSQVIAVTGDLKELGEWEAFVPLIYVKDGIWSNSITLPVDTTVEWKFVMVENGKINRWEECSNRCSKAAHDDFETQQWWGYP